MATINVDVFNQTIRDVHKAPTVIGMGFQVIMYIYLT